MARPHAAREPGALDDVEEEYDNLCFLLIDRTAGAPVRALELAISASDFWALRGHSIEGRSWLTEAMCAAAPTGLLRWRAELALARTRTLAEVAQLRDSLERACVEARADGESQVILGGLLIYLAIARGWQGDRAGAASVLDEVEALNRAIGSEWTSANIDHVRARPCAHRRLRRSPRLATLLRHTDARAR